MTRARVTLLALLAALAMGCGARAVMPEAIAASPPTSAVTGASVGSTAGSATGGATGNVDGAAPVATAQAALATGAARAVIIPVPPRPPVPRLDRSGFIVALDPGHGGDESGAAANGVVERDSNLDLAQRVGAFLEAAGVQVHYTRTDGGRAPEAAPGAAPETSGFSMTRSDLQARVSAANRAGADVFVSLHSNGSGNPSLRGVEVYYESRRPFADENYQLAAHLLDGALTGLANAGHPSHNRGIIDAACWRNSQGRCVGLFVLSPGGTTTTTTAAGASTGQVKEATNMPATLLETLFVSSPEDAALLRNDAVRTSVAQGIADGILRYLGISGSR